MYEIFKLLALFLSLVLAGGSPKSSAQDQTMQDLNPRMRPKMEIDFERVKASGIRRVRGKHIDIFTDLRDCPEIDELVVVFDLAIKEWCDYFNIDPKKTNAYRLAGFVIKDRARFQSAGLMPDDLPDFLAGFNRGHELWIYKQPGPYYTRHLLLHEGTHAFMQWFLGGSGPHWYSEGMAEKLALHRWKNGALELDYRVTDRSEVEYWGRPKLIREAREENRLKSIDDVFAIPNFEYRLVESYAWSWVVCEFLSEHPATQGPFGRLADKCFDTTDRFTADFLKTIESKRSTIDRDWQLFLNEHDYGIEAKVVVVQEAVTISGKNGFVIKAERGWQRTDIAVEKGDAWNIAATGRFQIADIGTPWFSEAGGVTIEYYQGSPIGSLLVGVIHENDVSGLLNPTAVGLAGKFTASTTGRLCFRINDAPTRMDDNSGHLEVFVEKAN